MDSTHVRESDPTTPVGELVVLNGRLKGTKRAIGTTVTIIGKAQSSDIRMNVDGIGPLHCLISYSSGEFYLRNLDGEVGTLVNGQRVGTCLLQDRDQLAIGPILLLVRLYRTPETEAEKNGLEDVEGLRIQVAAVAAQQASLTESELLLNQRQATLEQQQTELAAHLEEKRKRLVEMHSQAQAARQALKRERESFERFQEQATQDFSATEKELLAKQKHVEAQRDRLNTLRRNMKRRFHRQLTAERKKLAQREEELAEIYQYLELEHSKLEKEKSDITEGCLRFNTDLEIGRRQLEIRWSELRQEQERFYNERDKQLEEIEIWFESLEEREWEILGKETRLANEKRRISQSPLDLKQQNRDGHNRHQQINGPASGSTSGLTGYQSGQRTNLAVESEIPRKYPLVVLPTKWLAIEDWLLPRTEISHQAILQRELEEIAGELADQRLRLAKRWEQLLQIQEKWNLERNSISSQAMQLLNELQEKTRALMVREQQLAVALDDLREKHKEMVNFRQYLVGWQGRLRTHELSLAGERERLLAEVESKKEQADNQLSAVANLRKRWSAARQEEMDSLRKEKEAFEKERRELSKLNQEKHQQLKVLAEEKQALTHKTLAVEQYRQQILGKALNPDSAQRRIEKLERKWARHQEEAVIVFEAENKQLYLELVEMQNRYQELYDQFEELKSEQMTNADELAAWEHHHILSQTELGNLQSEVQTLKNQRDQAIQQLGQYQGEIEQIARTLLDEPPPPAILLSSQDSNSSDGNSEKAA